MTMIFKWTGDMLPSGAVVTPGQSGSGDRPISGQMEITPGVLGQGKVSIAKPGAAGTSEFENWLLFEDYAGGHTYLPFIFSEEYHMHNPVDLGDLPLEVYSLRMYFRMGALTALGLGPARIVAFANGSSYSFVYQLSQWEQPIGFPTRQYKPEIRNGGGPGGSLVATTGNAPLGGSSGQQAPFQCGTSWYRLEMQVDENRTPKVVARVYDTDGTSVSGQRTISGSPTTVAADRLVLGDPGTNGYQEHTYLAQIELHDDYDLGGQFTSNPTPPSAASTSATGAPVQRKSYSFAWTKENGEPEELEIEGVWDGESIVPVRWISDMHSPDIYFTEFDGHGWFTDWPDTDNSISWQGHSGEGWRMMSLYWPTRQAPKNGWPLVVWAHGGFYVSGNYRNLKRPFVKFLTHAGFAVASVAYRRSSITPLTYPPYSSDGGGRYPSHAIDMKNAANWLSVRASEGSGGDGTYPIDATKMIFAGFSAGGGIALTAGLTADLQDDGFGRSLKITDNDFGTEGKPGAPDPTPRGVVAFGGPTDLTDLIANDLNDPTMTLTAKAYLGLRTDQSIPAGSLEATTIPNLIQRQVAAGGYLPPVAYVRGTSDFLVHESQAEILEDAMATYAPSVPFQRIDAVGVVHDMLERILPYNQLIEWMHSVVED